MQPRFREIPTGRLVTARLWTTVNGMMLDTPTRRASRKTAATRPAALPALVLGAMLLAAPAAAQPSLELRITEREAFVNEPIAAQVILRDFRDAGKIQFPDLANAEVTQLGEPSTSTSAVIIQGRAKTSQSTIYTFEITPRAVGELVIPPIEARVDGAVLRTQPARIAVRAAQGDDLLLVEITSDRSRVYVGERIRLTLSLWIRPAETTRRTLTNSEMFQYLDGRRSALGPFGTPDRYSIKQRRSPDGAALNYYVWESSIDFTADRVGPLRFDDVVVAMQYPTRFGLDMFREEVATAVRRLRVPARVQSIEVLPLPSEGRPACFSGAVGRFSISAAASPTSVRVGDPIELTLEIRGQGPIDTLPPPPLHMQESLTNDFRVPNEQLAGSVVRGQRRFTQLIRAKRADVREVPPVEYCYFNPELGKYDIARSAPIPLQVAVAETLAGVDLTDGSGPPRPAATNSEPLDGLRGIETNEALLLASSPNVRLTHVAVVTLTPALVFLLAWGYVGWTQWRGGDPSRSRRSGALRSALRVLDAAPALAAGQQAQAIETALLHYLADRLDQPPARFTGPAAIALLTQRGAAPELVDQLRDIVQRCEAATYGGAAAGDSAALAAAARECVRKLEAIRL